MDIKKRSTAEFKDISVAETFRFLGVGEGGLSDSEVAERRNAYGANEITEKKGNPALDFVKRYWGPMPWLLELAMVLAVALDHITEGVIIFLLLTVNAVIGFLHAQGSHKAVDLLKKRLAVNAKVLRNGSFSTARSEEIVPGDIIVVKLGDIIPADVKIISGEISADESALTGESLPADRASGGIVFSSSIVRRGEARCVVLNTGAATYFGKTAELVKVAKPKSHQEAIMLAIVKYMMYLGIGASLAVAIYAFSLHLSVLLILTFIVVFLMGAVPVALPAVLTIVQAATGIKLASEGVLVTRLDSIEDAASISVLCLDKTGTITQNKLSVAESVPMSGFTGEDVVKTGSLASRAEGGDLIDLAVLDFAKEQGVDLDSCRQITYTPFNPATKRTEALIECGGRRYRAVKGAAQIILPLCDGGAPETKARVEELIAGFSQKGHRTIAVARSQDGEGETLRLVGLFALADPPRPDSSEMIAEMRALGVKPIMLTGDSMAIARQISQQVGIGPNVIRLADLTGLTEAEQAERVAASDGFAEIYPEDKYRLVKLLQTHGYMVGMTGDGVNDAPALKQAEMGIAVSNSTDVAKAAASVVLTEPGVQVIVEAIKRSRETYQRMLTWVINKVTKVVQVVGLLTVGFFLFKEMVLTLLGMSLLVFANDFVTMSLATDNVKNAPAPNSWKVSRITLASAAIGAFLVVEGILGLYLGRDYLHLSFPQLTTFILLILIFTSQFRVLIVRERGFFWASKPGKALLGSTAGAFVLFFLVGLFGLIVSPIGLTATALALGFSALFMLVMDIPKYFAFRLFKVA